MMTMKCYIANIGEVSFKNHLYVQAEIDCESQFSLEVEAGYKSKTSEMNTMDLSKGCIETHLRFFQSSDVQQFLNCNKYFHKLTRFPTSKHKSGDVGYITVPVLDEAHYEQVIREMKDREDHLEHTVSDSEVDNIKEDTTHTFLTDLYTSDDTNLRKKVKFSRRTPQFKHKARKLSKVDYQNKCLEEQDKTIQRLQDKSYEQATKVDHLNNLIEERDRTRVTIQVENNLLRQGIKHRARKSVEELFGIITQMNARNEAMEIQLGEYQRVKKGYLDDRPTILRIDDLNRILTATGFSEAESSHLIDGLGKKELTGKHSVRDRVLHDQIKVLEDERIKLDEQSLKYVRKYYDDTEALRKEITSMSAKVKVAGQTITQLEGNLAESKKAVEELLGITAQLNANNEAIKMQLDDPEPQILRIDDLHRIVTAAGFSEAESSQLLEKVNNPQDVQAIRQRVDNPLTTPPQDVCKQGINAIRQYYRDIEKTGTKVSSRQKLILLGDTGHGKTSLARTLLHGESWLADEDDRTRVLEKHTWKVDEDISIMIHDFGGHDVYNITHLLFITDQSINVLVFGLFAAEDVIHKSLQRWLSTIWNICPAASVLVVGTHFDKLSDSLVTEEKISKYISDIKQSKLDDTDKYITNTERKIEECKSQQRKTIDKEDCQNKLSHYRSIHEMLKKAKINVHFVSSSETLSGIMRLKMEIIERAKQRQFILPLGWIQVADEIKGNSDLVMSLEQVNELASQKRIKDSVDSLIDFMYNEGDILYYKENKYLKDIIFSDPQKVIDVMRSLFYHDLDTFFRWEDLKYSKYLDMKMFDEAKNRFTTKGILTKPLLECILSDFNLEETSIKAFIEMLKHFNLCFSCSDTMFQFPWYLKDKSAKELLPFCYDPHFVQIAIIFDENELPQAFFENSSVILEKYQKPTDKRRDASCQVYVKRNNTEFFMCATHSKINDILPNVKLTSFGKDLSEMWNFISNMTKEMEHLLETTWPGALYNITVDCPHCLLMGDRNPHHFDIFEYDHEVITVTCDKGDEDVPAVLVCRIDKKDYTADQNEALTKWTHRKEISTSSVNSSDLLDRTITNIELSKLATLLGVNWKKFAAEYLELESTVIDGAKPKLVPDMDPYDPALHVLQHWKNATTPTPTARTLVDLLKAAKKDGYITAAAFKIFKDKTVCR